jgi:hypothetical protein
VTDCVYRCVCGWSGIHPSVTDTGEPVETDPIKPYRGTRHASCCPQCYLSALTVENSP